MCAIIRVILNIKKSTMKDNKKTRCKKCGNFLFATTADGYLNFREGLNISSNGTEFKIKCNCKEITHVKLILDNN